MLAVSTPFVNQRVAYGSFSFNESGLDDLGIQNSLKSDGGSRIVLAKEALPAIIAEADDDGR